MSRGRCEACGCFTGGCEDTAQCYGNQLVAFIRRRVRAVRGWELDYCPMSGSLSLGSPDGEVWLYATPFYDGDTKRLPLQLQRDDGKAECSSMPAHWCFSDLDRDCARWVGLVAPVIAGVELAQGLPAVREAPEPEARGWVIDYPAHERVTP
ncbi:MAG: hypothetical protein ACYTFN_14810 [Planctomycetota bacterium]